MFYPIMGLRVNLQALISFIGAIEIPRDSKSLFLQQKEYSNNECPKSTDSD